MNVVDSGGNATKSKDNNILYIGSYLGSVILINMLAGKKATYYFLLITLLGVAMFNTGKYNIRVTTPEIMK